MNSVAEVLAPAQPPPAEQQREQPGSSPATPSFDFKAYMMERALLINAALDASVPRQYPYLINDAMRYGPCCNAPTLTLDPKYSCPCTMLRVQEFKAQGTYGNLHICLPQGDTCCPSRLAVQPRPLFKDI